jgi:hypothetical protein
MNPFVLGFLTKCSQLGLNQDQAVALLIKAAEGSLGATGSNPSVAPSTAATSPTPMSTGSNAAGSMLPGKTNSSAMASPQTNMPNSMNNPIRLPNTSIPNTPGMMQ